jgi:hypothetical protein
MHDYELTKERREREKAQVLLRFRTFAKRSTWKKARMQAKTAEAVRILKARQPTRIMIAIGSEDRWHLQLALRRFMRDNFYTNGQSWPGYSCKGALFSTCLLDELPKEKPVAWLETAIQPSDLLH